MQTIQTEIHGKFELRLVRTKTGYHGVLNRLGGGQEASIPGDDRDEIWRRLMAAALEASPGYFGFDGALARFRKDCPAGFDDAFYVAQERAYKDKARLLLEQTLKLPVVLQGGEGFAAAALKVYRATNLLASHEQMQLPRLLGGADGDGFVLAAARFAVGGDEPALLDMQRILRRHSLEKWTIATYLPFLWRPEQHMFLKPEVTRNFAAYVGHGFLHAYAPGLAIGVYRNLLDLAAKTAGELSRAGCAPRDNIDVQSFIWMIGEYGQAQIAAAQKGNDAAAGQAPGHGSAGR